VFPPEQLFYRLSKLDVKYKASVVATIAKYSSHRVPNRNHFALAKALEAGASLWTTNYDTLIEDALTILGLRFHVLSWPLDARCTVIGCGSLHFYKPHGSLHGGEPRNEQLVFDSKQVLLPLETSWRDAVTNDFSNKVIVLAGYKGNDIDLMPAISTTMRDSTSSALWMEFEKSVTEGQRSILPRTTVVPGNPSQKLQLHIARAISTNVNAFGPVVSYPTPEVEPVNFVRTHRATASLLSHVGDSGHARFQYALSALVDSPNDRKLSRRDFARSAILDYAIANAMAVRWAKIRLSRAATDAWTEEWDRFLLVLEKRGVRNWTNATIAAGTKHEPLAMWSNGFRQ
jgi:hypothetical protein